MPPERVPVAPGRILLIQMRQLGDVLQTSALLEDLRDAFPEARLDYLTGVRQAVMMKGNPFPSEVLLYDPEHPLRAAREIRSRHYDWIVDSQSSPRSAPLVALSGARRRIGWRINGPWRYVYTDRVPR